MNDLYPDFPSELWAPFANSRPPILCSPGYLIYLQGTEATCFYYLKRGRVRSFIQSEDGGERVLSLYGPGSLFGEAAFFDGLPRMSSAVALTPCQLVPIDRELVTREIARDPELAMAMLSYLARTVRMLSGHVDSATLPARQRVARYLLPLFPAGDSAPLSCTHEEIGQAVGLSRVTVSRVLGALARQGVLQLGYRQVVLLDRALLEQIAAEG